MYLMAYLGYCTWQGRKLWLFVYLRVFCQILLFKKDKLSSQGEKGEYFLLVLNFLIEKWIWSGVLCKTFEKCNYV